MPVRTLGGADPLESIARFYATRSAAQSSIPFVNSPYHAGELAVQARVGVREQADDLSGMFRDAIQPNLAGFLEQHPFAVLASADSGGRVWALPISGPAGILSVPDPRTLAIRLERLDPPLARELVSEGFGGLLVIDFDRRLRIRINGPLSVAPELLTLGVGQLYGNCNKYIQRRVPRSDGEVSASKAAANVQIFSELTESHRAWIARSDTFFIATDHRESGTDASHRGGRPGFITALDERTLLWPDYRGNNVFNSLGNLEEDPRCGLLFIDFDSGASLLMSGTAKADFGDPSSQAPTGRIVRFQVSAVRELPPAASLCYSPIEAFPYNPPVDT